MSKITKEQASRAREIADTYAKSQGKDNIGDIVEPIRADLSSENPTVREIALENARTAVVGLTKLILRQELFKTPNPDYMDKIINSFNDGVVNEGNSKIYDFQNATGNSAYVDNEFVPTDYTTVDADEFIIQMYNSATGSQQLSQQGYQFRKTLVYPAAKWIPYFKSGKLIEFIAMLEENMYFTWKCFIFNKIMDKITNTASRPSKVIRGTATNAFDAWANEILPEIRKMTTMSKNYNYKAAQTNLQFTNPSDLIIFAHPKTIQTLESGIKSQLFNAKLLDIKSILNENNLYDAGLKITVGNESQKITTHDTDYYVDENTVIILSKYALKHFTQIDRIETAFYGRNLATEFTMHKWGAMDALPWGQGFVYTNNNLNTLP